MSEHWPSEDLNKLIKKNSGKSFRILTYSFCLLAVFLVYVFTSSKRISELKADISEKADSVYYYKSELNRCCYDTVPRPIKRIENIYLSKLTGVTTEIILPVKKDSYSDAKEYMFAFELINDSDKNLKINSTSYPPADPQVTILFEENSQILPHTSFGFKLRTYRYMLEAYSFTEQNITLELLDDKTKKTVKLKFIIEL